jgi:hypothetical protein
MHGKIRYLCLENNTLKTILDHINKALADKGIAPISEEEVREYLAALPDISDTEHSEALRKMRQKMEQS